MPTPRERAAEDQQLLAGLRLGRRRRGEDLRRQHPLGQVVEPREVVHPPAGRDPTGVEEPLQGQLGVVPVPPGALRHRPLRQLAGHDRPPLRHHLVHGLDVAGPLLAHADHAAPRPLRRSRHLPAEQPVVLDRDVRRLVAPVLEQLAVGRRSREQVPRVRTEAGEQRQLLRAHEDVHRVDLDEPDPVHHPPQVAAVHPAGRARVGEALRGQRHPPGLRAGEGERGHRLDRPDDGPRVSRPR